MVCRVSSNPPTSWGAITEIVAFDKNNYRQAFIFLLFSIALRVNKHVGYVPYLKASVSSKKPAQKTN